MSNLTDKYRKLKTDVQRSVRYHNRRRGFFRQLHAGIMFICIIMGSGSILTIGIRFNESSEWPMWLIVIPSVIVTIVSALDLVVGTAAKSGEYTALYRRFIELEQEMISSHGKCTEEDIARWTEARLNIEIDEPPIMRIVDILCHNETARSIGSSDMYHVPITLRMVAHFTNWGMDRIHRVDQPSEVR